MQLRDIAIACLVVIILGVNFVAIKVGVHEVPPLLLTGLRFLFAAFPAVLFIKPPNVEAKYVIAFGLTLGVAQFGLLFTAIQWGMPAGLSSVVLQMQVFFTIGLAFICFGEKASLVQVGGAVVAATGIAIIGILKSTAAVPTGFMLVLGAALAWGVANTITKAAGNINMLSFVVWGSLAAPLPLFALSLLIEGRAAVTHALMHPSLSSVASLAFLAYPTTLLAFALWNNLLSRYPAATVAPFALLVPVAGLASTHFLLGEPISAGEIVGSGLVVAGLTLNISSALLLRRRRKAL